jgi:hypothetical protein
MEGTNEQTKTAVVYDAAFNPQHWADAQIFYGKS